ncbi:MAG: hypothetical protein C5B47_06340 [Verrucomicrobia bacterium]|nr:MAG: hypothetical protein C5B47_06340 [Verrucomicrobiota bacterium]
MPLPLFQHSVSFLLFTTLVWRPEGPLLRPLAPHPSHLTDFIANQLSKTSPHSLGRCHKFLEHKESFSGTSEQKSGNPAVSVHLTK